jgi:hypothetical protein
MTPDLPPIPCFQTARSADIQPHNAFSSKRVPEKAYIALHGIPLSGNCLGKLGASLQKLGMSPFADGSIDYEYDKDTTELTLKGVQLVLPDAASAFATTTLRGVSLNVLDNWQNTPTKEMQQKLLWQLPQIQLGRTMLEIDNQFLFQRWANFEATNTPSVKNTESDRQRFFAEQLQKFTFLPREIRAQLIERLPELTSKPQKIRLEVSPKGAPVSLAEISLLFLTPAGQESPLQQLVQQKLNWKLSQ